MYLNEMALKLIEESLISKALDLKLKIYFNIFKKFNLNYDEFKQLTRFVLEHYYDNDVNKELLDDMKPIFDKLNKNIKLPSIIYRGLNFKNQKYFKKFYNDIKSKKIIYKNDVLSWSKDIKSAEPFVTNFNRMKNNETGIIISLSKKNYEEYFLFSLYMFFKNDKEYRDFLELIYELSFVMDKEISKKIKLNKYDTFYAGNKILTGMNYLRQEKEILTRPINLKYLDEKNINFKIFKNNKMIKKLNYEEFLKYFKKGLK